MSYTKTNWVDGTTPLSASNMNKIENQLETNTNDIAGIIESGSNANGNWIKYADGTMICYKKVEITGLNINSAWGSLYENSSSISLGNFPQTFVDVPTITVDKTSGTGCWIQVNENITSSYAGDCYVVSATSRSGANINFEIIAIGRWK